jgi:acetylornithine deacetylase/succinyl-diaminopimelate desuccinylase-like protein
MHEKYATAGTDAATHLAEYLRINTTNPPGNETLGAEYLASILRKNNVETEVIPTDDKNRAFVYARLKGNGSKRPIILLNHIDVVPAQDKDWTYPPFSGDVHNGELWGRGALDMKGIGIAELEALLLIKRDGVRLDRDIIFLATPDEEVGGACGAGWIKSHRPELVKDAEFLLNEGAGIELDALGKQAYWAVDVAEKSVLWLKITAKGDAGHGSMPLKDSAPNKLVRALTRLVDSPVEFTVLPMVQRYFHDIAPLAPANLRDAYLDIGKSSQDPKIRELLLQDKQKAATLRNTVSLTELNAGYKTNVIPGEATAQLDCRLLPGVQKDDFIAEIQKKLGDPSLTIEAIDWQQAIPSSDHSELFDAVKAVANEETPGIPVVPVVVGWFTDSHWFRELGTTAYGFDGFAVDLEHLSTAHGKNERIPLSELTQGVRRFHQILLKLGANRG